VRKLVAIEATAVHCGGREAKMEIPAERFYLTTTLPYVNAVGSAGNGLNGRCVFPFTFLLLENLSKSLPKDSKGSE
jgi:hypothetical protein